MKEYRTFRNKRLLGTKSFLSKIVFHFYIVMVGDPVGDMLIRIKNAGMAKLPSVSIPYSKHKDAIAEILLKEGYIVHIHRRGKKASKRTLELDLKYGKGGAHRISGVSRMSKPGRRLYKACKDVLPVKEGSGMAIFSTPAGLKTDRDVRKEKVGGELLFTIW